MRLLAVFAHPDDEAYAAGGLIATLARDGARVVVVSATRGEAGHALCPIREPLADVRTRELAAACAALGAEPPRFLDLPDGGVDAADVAARLAPIVAELLPDDIVTLGPDGAYGHGDHLAVTEGVAAAAGRARVLHAVFPPGMFARVQRAMRRAGVRLVDVPLGAGAADLIIDVAPVRDRKLAAIAAHRSQRPDDDPRSFLHPGFIDPLLETERFAVAPREPARRS